MSTQPPRPPTAWGMGKASQNAGRGTTKASWTWGLRTLKRSLSKMGDLPAELEALVCQEAECVLQT